jgi:NAD(P)-dependent dehydrogenase (short-subunit alcohol dehydrogenase family)
VVGFGNLTGALRVRLVEGGRYESDSEQRPTPSPRIKPGNIAYAAVFLASEESRMITGHILPVDRSWTEGLATEAQLLIENGPSR